jgi:hypothetical protein
VRSLEDEKMWEKENDELNILGWDFSVSPKSLSTDFADYPDEIEEKRFHGEGADLRRLD